VIGLKHEADLEDEHQRHLVFAESQIIFRRTELPARW